MTDEKLTPERIATIAASDEIGWRYVRRETVLLARALLAAWEERDRLAADLAHALDGEQGALGLLEAVEQEIESRRAEGVQERARIVEWLREQADVAWEPSSYQIADAIERGEHEEGG